MSSELQFRILRLLEANPYLSQRELSKSLGASLGGVNYCLNALIAKGAVKIQNFKNNHNKWVYAYLLTPQGITEKAALTGSFLKRKIEEYEQLKQEIESLTHEVQIVEVVGLLEVATESSKEEIPKVEVGENING
jgi:EPS-associated MarR family transcriptional regulator